MVKTNNGRGSSAISKHKAVTKKPLVSYDDQIFVVHFDQLYEAENIGIYNRFHVKKNSYEKQLPDMVRYIDYFMRKYDTDNELMLAYLKIKFALDKERRFNVDNRNELISLMYDVMFTDTMIAKINQLVEDNYLDDIESSEMSQKYINQDKKHLESLEFKNEHIKALLRISFSMKCIAPILFHYTTINVIKPDKNSDLIFSFFKPLFDIFSYGDTSIYNKLYVYVKAKVLESKSKNQIIFEQREILGVDEQLVIDKFLKQVIISENMVKFKFSEKWDAKQGKYKENIIGLIKTIIKYQLMYFLKEQYKKNLSEVTSSKNADGLSGSDKMKVTQSSINEGSVICAEIGIPIEMDRIIKESGFEISDEEIEYYIKHLVISETQMQLLYTFWSEHFGSYRNMKFLTRKQYITLLLILKRKLLIQSGLNPNKFNSFAGLPYIITGNVHDKINTRIIRNNKFVEKINSSYIYQKKLKDIKYKSLLDIKPDYIVALLSKLINTRFTYVSYENQKALGEDILYDENRISDELLTFLNII